MIGAGVHGASVAFHLAGRGVRTVVIERSAAAGGPTGRSSAIVRAYYTNAFLASVARDSIGMFRDFEQHTGRSSGFRETGLLVLHPPEDEATVREVVPRLNDQGIPTDLLEPQQVVAEWPAFDLDGIAIAAFERDAGYADPVLTTQGMLERARELGAETRFGRVTAIEPEGDGVDAHDERGRHGHRRTRPDRRRTLVPGPRRDGRRRAAAHGRTPHRRDVRVERRRPRTAHGDLPNGYYFRPEGDELFLVGPLHPEPTVDPDDFDERVGPDEASQLGARVVKRAPPLLHATSRGGWASLYDVSPDWQPVIGEIAPGVFVDAGTSGHGFKLAPALGRHIADLITGAQVDPGLEQFHPRRFEQETELDAGFGEARILG